jgi:hypothetical protein
MSVDRAIDQHSEPGFMQTSRCRWVSTRCITWAITFDTRVAAGTIYARHGRGH